VEEEESSAPPVLEVSWNRFRTALFIVGYEFAGVGGAARRVQDRGSRLEGAGSGSAPSFLRRLQPPVSFRKKQSRSATARMRRRRLQAAVLACPLRLAVTCTSPFSSVSSPNVALQLPVQQQARLPHQRRWLGWQCPVPQQCQCRPWRRRLGLLPAPWRLRSRSPLQRPCPHLWLAWLCREPAVVHLAGISCRSKKMAMEESRSVSRSER
jgi:hypothetical protein